MAFIIQVVACIAFASVALSYPAESLDSYAPQSYEHFPLATGLQLPRADSASVPFYMPELSTVLKAPQYNSEHSYYEVPIPAQELVAPIQSAWNPENDPKFYYEVPAIITQQDSPTNSFPKKFNKDLHSKTKPFSSRPKQEITLQPIDEDEYNLKQKNLNKVFDSLAKKENRKLVAKYQQEQVDKKRAEPETAASGFSQGFDGEGVEHTRGLSADLTAALGITSPHSGGGERLDFHMVGHDGPHSYKWGFDTGKGHNRQFRYEERDKEGIVKGHFGFYDKHGKLQMVNYDSHPHAGFHAEGNFGKI